MINRRARRFTLLLAALMCVPAGIAPATAFAVTNDAASARSLSNAFRSAADKVLPAVVAIENRPKVVQTSQGMPDLSDRFGGQNPFEGTPFEDFFKNMPHEFYGFNQSPKHFVAGIGSGVIIDPSGIILTNNHVVEGDGEVTVRLYDGREFKATDVKTDAKTDLAIVKIDGATNLTSAPLGNSDRVQVGDWVLALGQPFGLQSTVTAGIISAKHRGIGIAARESFLQTDAAINPGNSGGPLVDLDGNVVGINTAISTRSGGNNGVGFAIPSNLAKWVVSQLENGGKVHRAYLGVGIQGITQDLASQFGVKPREGVIVTQVLPHTPAAKMGLQEGDIIVSLDGHSVDSATSLQLLVEESQLGKTYDMKIIRNGKDMTLSFIPEAQPDNYGQVANNGSRPSMGNSPQSNEWGMSLDDLTPDVAKQLGLEGIQGVVITEVQPGSLADEAGLEPGMVIKEINRKAVTNSAEASQALAQTNGEKGLLLLVQTDSGSRFVVLEK